MLTNSIPLTERLVLVGATVTCLHLYMIFLFQRDAAYFYFKGFFSSNIRNCIIKSATIDSKN